MEQIKLDIVPAGISPVAHASQFDMTRQIRFNLFNQGTPYTLTGAETVTMVVNGEEEAVTNTSDNYVIWDVAEEDCETSGVIACELRIILGSMLIGSKNFFLEVEMDPYDGKNLRIVTVGPADICTFETDLAEPLVSVKSAIVATQSGSGTPYPAGGGVNRWDEEWELGTIDASGQPAPSTTIIRPKNFTKINPNTEYCFRFGETGFIFWYDTNYDFISSQGGGALTDGCYFFTAPATAEYVKFRMSSNYGTTYKHDISINYPSTDHNYHPYANVRPINGYTGLNLTACGVNLAFKTISNASINSAGVIGVTPDYDLQCARVVEGVTYTITSDSNFVGGFYTSEPDVGSTSYDNSRIVGNSKTFTAPITGYVVFRTSAGYATPQLDVGGQATAYHAYNGTTYPVTWQDVAGTVYGGELDVTTGELTVTYLSVDMGSVTWNIRSGTTDTFFVNPTGAKARFNGLCSCYPKVSTAASSLGDKEWTSTGGNNLSFWFRDTAFDGYTGAQVASALTGQSFIYELATPQTYQLTPTQVRAIVGENNVYADCGQTELKYLDEE